MPEPNYKQGNRIFTLTSSLGENKLLVNSIQGLEGVSQLFIYNLLLFSQDDKVNAEKVLGKSVTIEFNTEEKQTRIINGMVSQFIKKKFTIENFHVYEAVVVPWYWFLNKKATCRIFQQKTIQEIIQEVIKDYQVKDIDFSKLTQQYPKIEYCVQYNETDYNFVNRLLEKNGIYYYFKHEKNKHTLVLSDSNNGYNNALSTKIQYQAKQDGIPQVTEWNHQYQFYSGKFTANSHDFMNAKANLSASTATVLSLAQAKSYEQYYYLGDYQKRNLGESFSKIDIEAEELNYDLVQGKSNYRSFSAGAKIQLDDNFFSDETVKEFVITELAFYMTDNSFLTSNAKGLQYENQFTAIPSAKTFRPAILATKPIIFGVHEAITTGPTDSEFHTDKYGRYKVKFYWDRSQTQDDKSSCWLRSTQHWEGLLRVGTPVLVSFINGDVDRPIIVGPVVDSNRMPLYDLSDKQTYSAIKRRPGTNGKDEHYNYIAFNDAKDNELLQYYAGKDLQGDIENNREVTLKKGNDQLTINEGDLTIKIVKGKYVLQAKKAVDVSCDGDISFKAKGNITIQAEKALNIEAQSAEVKTKTSLSQNIGTSIDIKAKTSATLQAASAEINAKTNLALKSAMIQEN